MKKILFGLMLAGGGLALQAAPVCPSAAVDAQYQEDIKCHVLAHMLFGRAIRDKYSHRCPKRADAIAGIVTVRSEMSQDAFEQMFTGVQGLTHEARIQFLENIDIHDVFLVIESVSERLFDADPTGAVRVQRPFTTCDNSMSQKDIAFEIMLEITECAQKSAAISATERAELNKLHTILKYCFDKNSAMLIVAKMSGLTNFLTAVATNADDMAYMKKRGVLDDPTASEVVLIRNIIKQRINTK